MNNPNLSVELKVYLKKIIASCSCCHNESYLGYLVAGNLFARRYSLGLLPVPIDVTRLIRYSLSISG